MATSPVAAIRLIRSLVCDIVRLEILWSKDKANMVSDSTMGKLMEKAGGMFKNEGMAEKGREKREAKGFDETGDNY